jgi:hypothetical protein
VGKEWKLMLLKCGVRDRAVKGTGQDRTGQMIKRLPGQRQHLSHAFKENKNTQERQGCHLPMDVVDRVQRKVEHDHVVDLWNVQSTGREIGAN